MICGAVMMDLVFGALRTVLNYFGLLIQFQGKAGDSPEKDYMLILRDSEERE